MNMSWPKLRELTCNVNAVAAGSIPAFPERVCSSVVEHEISSFDSRPKFNYGHGGRCNESTNDSP